MALQRQQRRALRIQLLSVRPDLDRPFGIGRGQLRAVAREGHRRDGRRVSGLMLCDRAACGRVENEQRPDSFAPTAIRWPSGVKRGGIATFHRHQSPLPAESLSSRSHPGGRSKQIGPCHRGRRRPASDHRQTKRTLFDVGRISDRRMRSPRRSRRSHHRILSSTMTNLSPSREKIRRRTASIRPNRSELLFARGGVKDVNLVAFGQRGQPSVGRQDADLSARARRAGRGGSLRLRAANPGPSASPGRSDPASPVDRPR